MSKSRRKEAKRRAATVARSARRTDGRGAAHGAAHGAGAGAGAERDESRVAVALTVAWMLCLLATLLAVLASLAALGLTRIFPPSPEAPDLLGLLSGVLRLTAVVTGSLCLVLTVVAYRVRRRRPPLAVTVAAVASGLAAWGMLVL